jgi:hypothetical protein
LIIPIIWASVKRLCRICLLLQRLSKLYIKVRDVSGGRSDRSADLDLRNLPIEVPRREALTK